MAFIDLIFKCIIPFHLKDDDQTIVEARVRYLSFLGIGKNVKNCAFIVHTAQDKYIAYVFRCEPSSGALCKTIEAACKVSMKKSQISLQFYFTKNPPLASLSEMSRCTSN